MNGELSAVSEIIEEIKLTYLEFHQPYTPVERKKVLREKFMEYLDEITKKGL